VFRLAFEDIFAEQIHEFDHGAADFEFAVGGHELVFVEHCWLVFWAKRGDGDREPQLLFCFSHRDYTVQQGVECTAVDIDAQLPGGFTLEDVGDNVVQYDLNVCSVGVWPVGDGWGAPLRYMSRKGSRLSYPVSLKRSLRDLSPTKWVVSSHDGVGILFGITRAPT
jgi:hypothetical protein